MNFLPQMIRLSDYPIIRETIFTQIITSFGYLIIVLIRLYQWCISPWLGACCRFSPSCSHYAIKAIEAHGALNGSLLTLRRLLRCHPFGPSGYDPVPPGK